MVEIPTQGPFDLTLLLMAIESLDRQLAHMLEGRVITQMPIEHQEKVLELQRKRIALAEYWREHYG
jgi:hypothetical protein